MLANRHRRLRMEGLEHRTMMAADLVDGMLSIAGTNLNDNIQVQIASTGAHAGDIQVDVNSEQSFFAVGQVSSIEIFGLAGDDTIAVDHSISIDTLINGGKGNDTIQGGDGNDTIRGAAGNDTIDGGEGDNDIFGDAGNDTITGGHDDDTIFGGAGDDTINADNGDDTVYGDAGNDAILGGSGDDLLFGGVGNDTINGENGNDTCHGDNGNDDVHGGANDDFIFGENGLLDTLWGDDGNDAIDGGNGIDICRGGQGDDQVKGGNGFDQLDGEQGNNLLDPDQGLDTVANGVVCDLDLEVRALLAGLNSESAVVKFDVKIDGVGTKNEFSVEVENLAANTTFDVIIGRITVGQITTDGSGDGELKFSTDPGGGELPFPADFPLIKAKTKISIGTVLLGKFEKWQWV